MLFLAALLNIALAYWSFDIIFVQGVVARADVASADDAGGDADGIVLPQ